MKGKRIAGDNVTYLSAIDPTPWQIEKMLEVSVSVATRVFEVRGQSRTVAAIGINHEDVEEVMAVAKNENLFILCDEDEEKK